MPGAVITFQTLVKNNYPTRPHHLGYAYATEQAPVQKKKTCCGNHVVSSHSKNDCASTQEREKFLKAYSNKFAF